MHIAVADHDIAALQRRLYDFGDVLRTRGSEEEKLCQRFDLLLGHYSPDLLSERRATGFVGYDNVPSETLES
jgi:hypothetical protein